MFALPRRINTTIQKVLNRILEFQDFYGVMIKLLSLKKVDVMWCHQPVLKKEPYEIKFWSPIRLLLRTLIINYIIHWPLYKASQEKFFSVLILGITLLCMSNWFVFVFWILQMMKLSFFFWLPAKNLRARSVVGSPRVKE